MTRYLRQSADSWAQMPEQFANNTGWADALIADEQAAADKREASYERGEAMAWDLEDEK